MVSSKRICVRSDQEYKQNEYVKVQIHKKMIHKHTICGKEKPSDCKTLNLKVRGHVNNSSTRELVKPKRKRNTLTTKSSKVAPQSLLYFCDMSL